MGSPRCLSRACMVPRDHGYLNGLALDAQVTALAVMRLTLRLPSLPAEPLWARLLTLSARLHSWGIARQRQQESRLCLCYQPGSHMQWCVPFQRRPRPSRVSQECLDMDKSRERVLMKVPPVSISHVVCG